MTARTRELARLLEATPPAGAVGLLIGNEPAFVVAFLACLHAGRAALLLDPRWTCHERRQALGQVELSVIVHATERLDSEYEQIPGRVELDAVGRLRSRALDALPAPRTNTDGVAVIHWSSGSTGTPKPIAVSRAALEFRVTSLVEVLELRDTDRMLCCVPLSHCHGLDCIALPALAARAELVLLDPLEALPPRVLEAIEDHGVTAFSAMPRFFAQLLRSAAFDPERLRTVRLPLSGSAALDPDVAREFEQRVGTRIRNGYGLTEIGIVSLNRRTGDPARFESVGQFMPGIEWRIGDRDADGSGELQVRSAGLAAAYSAGEQLTRTEHGWLCTGDVVQVDERGDLLVLGRHSQFVNVDGAKADPREIEAVIARLPWVEECAVAGVTGESGAERIVAYVVPREDAAAELSTEETVRQHVGQSLSFYKVPAEVVFLETLPRNTLGKLLYFRLPEPAEVPAPDAGSPPPRTPGERAVAAIWCDVIGLERVGVQDNFIDVGGTSVHLAALLPRLREQFACELAAIDLFRYPTIETQTAFLAGRLGARPADSPTSATTTAAERGRRQRSARHPNRNVDRDVAPPTPDVEP